MIEGFEVLLNTFTINLLSFASSFDILISVFSDPPIDELFKSLAL